MYKRIVSILATIVAVLATSGCAGLTTPADPSKMTPEQLIASAKDRSVIASCTILTLPGGSARTSYSQLDKGTISTGSVIVDKDCSIAIQLETTVKSLVIPQVTNAPAK